MHVLGTQTLGYLYRLHLFKKCWDSINRPLSNDRCSPTIGLRASPFSASVTDHTKLHTASVMAATTDSDRLSGCMSCKTMGNNNARLCNLCDVRMCRPGNVLPSPDRPRLVTTTFENDWTHLHNRWMVPQLLWKPHILTLLMHFWCLIQDIRDTQMLHLSMHFVTAVTITLNNNAESLNPGPRPHTTQVVEFAEYSDSSSNP